MAYFISLRLFLSAGTDGRGTSYFTVADLTGDSLGCRSRDVGGRIGERLAPRLGRASERSRARQVGCHSCVLN
jgi:hypothetical protein